VNWERELIGAAVLAALFAMMVLVAELWARLAKPKPEWTRKLVHLGGGMACLAFPFVIASPWTVLVMAVLLSGTFALGARTGFLSSLHRVRRPTRGSEYYPLAIFVAYVLAYGRPWLYVSSVLTLSVADAFAALIGGRYGRLRYQVEDEQKSLEGSLAFLAIAFTAIWLPMVCMTDSPGWVCLLSALLVAVLVTGFEAISLRGSDNLFVPTAVCTILSKITTKPLTEIIHQNLSLAVICLGIGLLAWRTRVLNVGGAIVAILFAYATWSLGSWQWALPVFLGLGTYLLAEVFAPVPVERLRRVRVGTMTRALLSPFVLLVLANAFGQYGLFFGPYMAAITTVLAFALWGFLRHRWPESGSERLAGSMAACLCAILLVVLPLWLLQGLSAASLVPVTGVTVAACALDWLLTNVRKGDAPEIIWGPCKVLLVFGAAATVIVLQEFRLAPMWSPS